jgi:cytidine deaminase
MDRFVDLALEQSLFSDTQHKHGSVLVLCKNQIFTGYNHYTSSKYSVTIHSEEHAINNFIEWCRVRRCTSSFIRRKLNRSFLLTIRSKNNNIKYSPPCNRCIDLIKKYGIKKVLYSEMDGDTLESYMESKKVRDMQPSLHISSGYRYLERKVN